MTRVAGIPAELQALAAILVGSAPELDVAAASLASAASLPPMPAGVAAQVESALDEARNLIVRASQTAAGEGEDLRRRGLWLEIADRLHRSWEAVAAPFGLVATSNDTLDLATEWRVSRLMKTWNAYEDAVGPAVAAEGPTSLAALDAKLGFQESNPMAPARFATVLEGAGDEGSYLESLGSLAGIGETVGKFTPIGGVFGGVVGFSYPKNRTGTYMYVDRAAAAGTTAGSIGLLLASTPALAAVPVVGEVALAVVVVAGAWELWENKDEIARIAVAGGKFVANHPYVLAGPPGIAVHEAWKYRKPIAHALVSAADTDKDLADDGAKTILSGAKSALEHVVPHVHVGGLSTP
jgi:hypothetical protein